MKTHINLALGGSLGNATAFLIMVFINFKIALTIFSCGQLFWILVYLFGELFLGLQKDKLEMEKKYGKI